MCSCHLGHTFVPLDMILHMIKMFSKVLFVYQRRGRHLQDGAVEKSDCGAGQLLGPCHPPAQGYACQDAPPDCRGICKRTCSKTGPRLGSRLQPIQSRHDMEGEGAGHTSLANGRAHNLGETALEKREKDPQSKPRACGARLRRSRLSDCHGNGKTITGHRDRGALRSSNGCPCRRCIRTLRSQAAGTGWGDQDSVASGARNSSADPVSLNGLFAGSRFHCVTAHSSRGNMLRNCNANNLPENGDKWFPLFL